MAYSCGKMFSTSPVRRALRSNLTGLTKFVPTLCTSRTPNGFRFVSDIVDRPNIADFNISNEECLSYTESSPEKDSLKKALNKYVDSVVEVPIVIGDKEIQSNEVRYQVMPFDHGKRIARFYYASTEMIQNAIEVACEAQHEWEKVPLQEKIHIFLNAADLCATKYRMDLNATTMLGQAKTVIQAEIDAAAELIDFLRFNAYFAKELVKYDPISPNPSVTKNSLRYRGIEGFINAIAPFNFTAIGGNLAAAPAMMGNVVLWKPSDTAVLSNYTIFKCLREAGVPAGVINFIPADGPVFGNATLSSPKLAGINFTGSYNTFIHLWKQIGSNIEHYHNFPRIVGECGGKNFHLVHPSADLETVAPSTIRSAFEYSGQKCSACSRIYVPKSVWPQLKEKLEGIRKELKISSPLEFDTFTSAVIDEKAFKRIKSYIDLAKNDPDITIVGGGTCDDRQGYYVEPTIIQTTNPLHKIMREEIFGPVLAVYVYEDKTVEEIIPLIKNSTTYGLTGAVYSQDEKFARQALEELKMAAGNFYVNDKSTGSVVGQQPFGGSRHSGTNDKAGGPHYVLKWTSPQSIKQTFVPLTDWKYPYMSK